MRTALPADAQGPACAGSGRCRSVWSLLARHRVAQQAVEERHLHGHNVGGRSTVSRVAAPDNGSIRLCDPDGYVLLHRQGDRLIWLHSPAVRAVLAALDNNRLREVVHELKRVPGSAAACRRGQQRDQDCTGSCRTPHTATVTAWRPDWSNSCGFGNGTYRLSGSTSASRASRAAMVRPCLSTSRARADSAGPMTPPPEAARRSRKSVGVSVLAGRRLPPLASRSRSRCIKTILSRLPETGFAVSEGNGNHPCPCGRSGQAHAGGGLPSSGTISTTSPPRSVYVRWLLVTTAVPCPTQSSGGLVASSGSSGSPSTACGGAFQTRPSAVTGCMPHFRARPRGPRRQRSGGRSRGWRDRKTAWHLRAAGRRGSSHGSSEGDAGRSLAHAHETKHDARWFSAGIGTHFSSGGTANGAAATCSRRVTRRHLASGMRPAAQAEALART